MSTMGSRIREAREARKLTQEFVAEAIGKSKGTISQWENDTTLPNGRNLISLSYLLGVSPEYLLDGTIFSLDEGKDEKAVSFEIIRLMQELKPSQLAELFHRAKNLSKPEK